MKSYRGTRIGGTPPRHTDTLVKVVVESSDGIVDEYPLPNRATDKSPDGFEWGYGGSGPSALAKSILWDHLGEEPTPACFQDLKAAFIVNLQRDGGFEVVDSEIASWLQAWTEQHPGSFPTTAAYRRHVAS